MEASWLAAGGAIVSAVAAVIALFQARAAKQEAGSVRVIVQALEVNVQSKAAP